MTSCDGGSEQTGGRIGLAVGRGRRWVDKWLARYRQLGLAGLEPGKGNEPTLAAESCGLLPPSTACKLPHGTGSRPERVEQAEYAWAHRLAAIDPLTGDNSAMLASHADTHSTSAHLRFISDAAKPRERVVLVLDGAGRHESKALQVAAHVTLPPYSPELNRGERVRRTLRQDYLGNRLFKDCDEIFAEVKAVWNWLTPEQLTSITATAEVRTIYMETAGQVPRPLCRPCRSGSGNARPIAARAPVTAVRRRPSWPATRATPPPRSPAARPVVRPMSPSPGRPAAAG